jgi:hypothetical protein
MRHTAPGPVLDYRNAAQDRREERRALREGAADAIVYAAVWGSVTVVMLILAGAAVLWGVLVSVAAAG